ncbi:hypothetical protein Desor_2821 [Desulfosporosinus orientis DSM 765]|uniref:Uncharacterized protein n=1 Tax=Desulfosporosinus orientis (strain ATCC 19365 / DSM 765 / NCIMB 8382 / VKM B-1628 / Singapore I) TaxID=768706 RepID=G7WDN4_DESOD|nr:hypothetical protein [Desulfosporosinus orientis]AET68359.1 hypothetical protein Desor_2821 [Desulfosporosinus orientis DSM 765]
MSKQLYKILWSLAILTILITTVIFSFGIIMIGAVTIGLYGIYRYYFPRKKRASNNFSRSQVHPFGEVIDIKSEVIHQTIETKRTK